MAMNIVINEANKDITPLDMLASCVRKEILRQLYFVYYDYLCH